MLSVVILATRLSNTLTTTINHGNCYNDPSSGQLFAAVTDIFTEAILMSFKANLNPTNGRRIYTILYNRSFYDPHP